MDSNIKAQIRHLCGYITDKSAVLNYINRENNLRFTMKDIEQALLNDNRRRPANRKPLKPSPLITTHNTRGYDPLARALFQYHADRTTGADHDFWLSRLTSRKRHKTFTVDM
jgi:hypothetical protein